MTTARKRILVADDDAAIRLLVARALERIYDVVTAEDGPGALSLLTHPPYPDLAILDVMMPGFDGFGVTARLKLIPNLPHIPIVFLTARDGPGDLVRGIQSGARHYITKPFAIKDLLDKVDRVLRG